MENYRAIKTGNYSEGWQETVQWLEQCDGLYTLSKNFKRKLGEMGCCLNL